MAGIFRQTGNMLFEPFYVVSSISFVERAVNKTFYNINVKSHNAKSPVLRDICGLDGTRTRDLRRDRAAF